MSCAVCQEELGDDIVEVDLGVIHDSCFACCICFSSIEDDSFFFQNGKLYCQDDYLLQFSNRCKRCAFPIEDKSVSALNGKWHTEHFICENCARPLVNIKYTVRDDDKPYCVSCEKSLREQEKRELAQLCTMCKKPAKATEIIMINGGKERVHAHHFTCQICRTVLQAATSKELDNAWYCGKCFTRISSRVCESCRKPILGRCITALGKTWHAEHFSCAICETSFQNDPYYEWNGKAYCIDHYNEARGQLCLRCGQPAKGNAITAFRRTWCENHFTCCCCDVHLAVDSPKGTITCNWDEKPTCGKCYDMLPLEVRSRLNNYAELEKKNFQAKSEVNLEKNKQ